MASKLTPTQIKAIIEEMKEEKEKEARRKKLIDNEIDYEIKKFLYRD